MARKLTASDLLASPQRNNNRSITTTPKLTGTPLFFDTTYHLSTSPPHKKPYWGLTPYASLPRPHGTAATLKARLRALGLHFKPLATARRCEKLLHRFERGLLTYETLSLAALTTFAHQRHLPCVVETGQHDKMVRLLERADDELKFEKFLELPAELRVMVYEFHLEGLELPRGERRVRPPPVCRTSSLLRREALPLFEATKK